MAPNRLKVVVTRRLPEAVETRLTELFDVTLNDADQPMSRAALGEAMRTAEIFRARVMDTTTESFVFELTGAPDKIDAFVELMVPLGLVEVARTGVAAMARGSH